MMKSPRGDRLRVTSLLMEPVKAWLITLVRDHEGTLQCRVSFPDFSCNKALPKSDD